MAQANQFPTPFRERVWNRELSIEGRIAIWHISPLVLSAPLSLLSDGDKPTVGVGMAVVEYSNQFWALNLVAQCRILCRMTPPLFLIECCFRCSAERRRAYSLFSACWFDIDRDLFRSCIHEKNRRRRDSNSGPPAPQYDA